MDINYKDVKKIICDMLRETIAKVEDMDSLVDKIITKEGKYHVETNAELGILIKNERYQGIIKGLNDLLLRLEKEEKDKLDSIKRDIEKCIKNDDFVDVIIDPDKIIK